MDVDYNEIILDHQELAKELLEGHIIERDVPYDLTLNYLKYPNIVAVLGVRRSGKTTFSLNALKNKKFIYINFDDERLYNLKTSDLNNLLKSAYKLKDFEYIILDEVQNIKGWELFVNRLRNTKKVIITGSNSNLLSYELSTHLTGRHMDIYLFPFSFKEHLRMKEKEFLLRKPGYSTKEKAIILRELEDYLMYGGFPERYKFGVEILRYLVDDIINKDIIKRMKIKKISDFEKFTFSIISNFSSKFSLKRTSKIFNLNHVTISQWLKSLESAFLVFFLNKFSFKTKEIIKSNPKIYLIDNGIFTIKGFKFSENKGKLMENVVFIELLRKKHYYNMNLEMYYYEDQINRYQIDFLIKEGNNIKELIQVTYANSYEEIKEREIRALLHAKEELNLGDEVPLTVITWDYEDTREVEWWRKRGKIRFVPLWKWLLQV